MIDLAAVREFLQPDWVSRFETAGRNAFRHLPTRRPLVVRGQIRRRIESLSSVDCVRVAVACVIGDPFTAAAFAVVAKFRRTDRRFEQAGAAERVGNCSRTIVASIDK